MATIAELRAAYPDFLKDKSDTDIVRMLAEKDGLSLPYVAYELGLDPAEWQQNEGAMDDLGTSVELGWEQTKRGIANLPNVVSGLVTGENLYETPGMDDTIQRIQTTFSPGYYEAQQAQDSAWDEGRYLDYAAGLVTTPYLANQVAQSVPSLVGGGIVGAGLRGVAALGALGRGAIARGVGTAAPFIGEGSVSTGVGYKNLLDQGVDPQTAALASTAMGAGVGAISGASGYLANRVGIVDPERFFAGMTRRVGDDTVPLSYRGQIGYGMLAEGGEEALQSPWEEAMSNVAQDKPWDEGLGRAALEGGLAGGIIGGGINALTPPLRRKIDINTQTDLLQDEQQADPAQPGINPPSNQTPNIDPLAAARQRQIDAIMGGETSQTILPGQADPGSLQGLTREQINQRLIDAAMGGETSRTFAPGQYPSDVAADLSQQQAKVNATRAAEQAKKAVEKQYEKAGWQKTPEKIALLETAQAPKLVSGIYGDEARKFVDSVLTMDAKTAGELFTNLSGSKSKSAPWKAAIAKAHLTNLAQQEAQTLAQQAKQSAANTSQPNPDTSTEADAKTRVNPTTSSVVAPEGVNAVPEGGSPPVVQPADTPSPTTPETPTNALSGQTTPQAGQETGTTPPDATTEPGVEPEVAVPDYKTLVWGPVVSSTDVKDANGQVNIKSVQVSEDGAWELHRVRTRPQNGRSKNVSIQVVPNPNPPAPTVAAAPTPVPVPPAQPAAPTGPSPVVEKAVTGAPLTNWELDDVVLELGQDILTNELADRVNGWVKPVPKLTKSAERDPQKVAAHNEAVARREQRLDQLRKTVLEVVRNRLALGPYDGAEPDSYDTLASTFILRDTDGRPVLDENNNPVSLPDMRKGTKYGVWTQTQVKALDDLLRLALVRRGVNLNTVDRAEARDVDPDAAIQEVQYDNQTLGASGGVRFQDDALDVSGEGADAAKGVRDLSSLGDVGRQAFSNDVPPGAAAPKAPATEGETEAKPVNIWDGEVDLGTDATHSNIGGADTGAGRKVSGASLMHWARRAGYDVEADPPAAKAKAAADLKELHPLARQSWVDAVNQHAPSTRNEELDATNATMLDALYRSVSEYQPNERRIGRVGISLRRDTDTIAKTKSAEGLYNLHRAKVPDAPDYTGLLPTEVELFTEATRSTVGPGLNRDAFLRKAIGLIVAGRKQSAQSLLRAGEPATAAGDASRDAGAAADNGQASLRARAGVGETESGAAVESGGQAEPDIVIGARDATGIAVKKRGRLSKEALAAGRESTQSDAATVKRAVRAAGTKTEPQVQQGLGEDVAATNPTTEQTLRDTIASLLGKGHNWRIHVYATPEAAHAAGHTPRKVGNAYGWVEADQKGVKHAYFIVNRIEQGTELGAFLHEVGVHIGIENILTAAELTNLVNQLRKWAAKNDDNLESRLAKAALARVQYAQEQGGVTNPNHELIAYFLEEAVKAGVNPTATRANSPLGTWLLRLWTAFKRALNRLKLENLDRLTPQDVVNLAYGAARMELQPGWLGNLVRTLSGEQMEPALQYGVELVEKVDPRKYVKLHNALGVDQDEPAERTAAANARTVSRIRAVPGRRFWRVPNGRRTAESSKAVRQALRFFTHGNTTGLTPDKATVIDTGETPSINVVHWDVPLPVGNGKTLHGFYTSSFFDKDPDTGNWHYVVDIAPEAFVPSQKTADDAFFAAIGAGVIASVSLEALPNGSVEVHVSGPEHGSPATERLRRMGVKLETGQYGKDGIEYLRVKVGKLLSRQIGRLALRGRWLHMLDEPDVFWTRDTGANPTDEKTLYSWPQAQRHYGIAYLELGSGIPSTIVVDGVERPTQNSEGKPIHSTLSGILNFWKWFGDSKVVDDQGRPLVVYHGTDKDFTAFKPSKAGNLGPGIYFTPDAKQAEEYAKTHNGTRVVEVYLRAENPLLIDNSNTSGEQLYDAFPADTDAETIKKVRAAGHDAVWAVNSAETPWGNTAREIAVYEPTQIKSATDNVGTFDGTTPNISYGIAAPSHITSAREAVHNALSDTYTGANRGLLGWMGINNIAERFGETLPILKSIEKTFNEMSHQAQVWLDRGDQIERMWSMLTPKQTELVNDIAGSATLQRFDPSKDKADTPEKQEIAKKWQALKALDAANPKVKGTTVILAAVKHYRDVMQESLDHLEDVLKQAQAAGASTHAIESLKTTVKSLKKKQTHFWLPLHRFGDFHSVGMSTTLFALHQRYKQHLDDVRNNAANPAAWSPADEKLYQKLRTDPKHYEVVGHDSERAARRHAEKLQAKGWKATSNINRFTTDLARAHLKPELEAFEKMLAHTKIDPKVATKLIDSYTDLLIEALPDGHILKHQLEREGIAGWDKDMKRAFAKTAQSQAYAVSRLLHTRKLSEQLDKLNRQGESFQPHAQLARDLHNELLKQQELAVTRSEDPYFVRFATGFNYMSMLGGSPFFWALQLAQVPTITLPYLIGRNGANVSDTFSKLTAAWKQATGYIKWSVEANEWRAELDFARAVKGVSKEELEALKEMDRAGRFVFTIGQDLGAAAEGRNTKTARFIRSLNAPTQTTELINRVSTGLAAYRISRKNNDHAKAVEFALRTVDNTQVNMDPVMGARNLKTVFGQSGNLSRSAAKIIFQFWKFQQGMAYTTLTTMKDAWDHPDPALRKQARDSAIGLTISLITTSGIFGLPFVGTGMMLLSFLFGLDGDDDEDDNVERMAKNWIRESPLPKVVADTLNKGFLSAILPTDSAPYLSPRFSLGNLMNPLGYARFDDAERGEDVVKEVMFRVLGGPTGSSAAAFWDGIQAGLDGDYAKATEKMVPLKLMRDLARAYTLSDQGVATGEGEERINPDRVSFADLVWQGMGVTPMKKGMYHEGQAGVQALKNAVMGERNKLLADYAQARLKGEDVTPHIQKHIRFSQRHPEVPIREQHRRQSVDRRKDIRKTLTETGILADKQNRPFLGNAAWTM